jgi:hypothetical protein
MKSEILRPYLIRLLIVFILSTVGAWIFNEAAYVLQKDEYDRSPRTVELVIPEGTAARVAAGEEVSAIPGEMVFVLGDTLLVRNEDVISHELGPLWVPAHSTASLLMEKPQSVSYSCSFQSSRYFGLDVRQPTTWTTRITALSLTAPTTTVLAYMYSLLIFPIKDKKQPAQEKAVHESRNGSSACEKPQNGRV